MNFQTKLLNKIKENTGLALRFPKFTGKIRTEKNSEDASTDEEVIALYKVQKKTTNQDQVLNSLNQALIFSPNIMITCYVQWGIGSTGKTKSSCRITR